MADEQTGGTNAGGAHTGGQPQGGGDNGGQGQNPDNGSQNPTLDAAANSPEANPPAAGDEPRIVKPIDEVQREVDDKGVTSAHRSQASAGQMTKDGVSGAPDGFGVGLEGGAGQSAPVDTTEEAEDEDDGDDKKPKRQSRKAADKK